MLTLELNGQRYSKTEHAEALLQVLDDRSRPSLEFKHGNISAVLLELGYPYIDGYKPRANYQRLLIDVVEAQLGTAKSLQEAVQAAVERPATVIDPATDMPIQVPPPKPARIREINGPYAPRFSAVRRDYLAQEARNRSLGRAGELLVVDLEVRRLHAAGKKTLSERVEHVAESKGDGLGFDVLSFETDGSERLIEVKTTSFGDLTPFYVSRNELARSEVDALRYRLVRLFDFRSAPKLYELRGAISSNCQLDACSYLARIAG